MEDLWQQFVEKGVVDTKSMMVIPAAKRRAKVAKIYKMVSRR